MIHKGGSEAAEHRHPERQRQIDFRPQLTGRSLSLLLFAPPPLWPSPDHWKVISCQTKEGRMARYELSAEENIFSMEFWSWLSRQSVWPCLAWDPGSHHDPCGARLREMSADGYPG